MKKVWCVELAAEITAIIDEEEDTVEAGGKIVEHLRERQSGGLCVCDNEQTT